MNMELWKCEIVKVWKYGNVVARSLVVCIIAYFHISTFSHCEAQTASAPRTGPWTKEKAWEWYSKQPWIRGCNYMPASAANRVDQWQALGSEERFAEVERELALAEEIGFNAMRIIVEVQGFGVWLADHDGFMERFERYLTILDRHKMRACVLLGNDCMRPKEFWKMPTPGPQKFDWGYHGGRKMSQHGSFPDAIGYSPVDDPELAPKFYAMCEELMTKYRADRRILMWNLWNEPGNSNRGDITAPQMKKLFELAWRIDPVQPRAADLWSTFGVRGKDERKKRVEAWAGELSDVISYHCYGDYEAQVRAIAFLKRRYGRPMFNTEWLHRINHNDVQTAYPLYCLEKIGCFCWGFVAGKYQTYEPWEGLWKLEEQGKADHLDFTRWQHDLIRPSMRPYDPKEIKLIKRFNNLADGKSVW